MDNIPDIRLAVVTQNDQIGVLQRALAPQRFHNGAELLIMLAQLCRHLFVPDTVLVTGAVQIAHLDQHDIRLFIVLQNIQCHGHGQQIQTAIRSLDVAAVLIEIAIHEIFGGHILQIGIGIPAGIVVGHNHGHIHGVICAAGHRPGDGTGGKTVFSCPVQQCGHLHIGLFAVPWLIPVTAPPDFFIVVHTMPVHIAAGDDRCMAAVGQRRPHRLNLTDHGGALQIGAEVWHVAHQFHIAGAQCVQTEYQYFTHGYLLQAGAKKRDSSMCILCTIPAAAAHRPAAAGVRDYTNGRESAPWD